MKKRGRIKDGKSEASVRVHSLASFFRALSAIGERAVSEKKTFLSNPNVVKPILALARNLR